MRNRTFAVALGAAVALLVGGAVAQVDCPVIGGGGNATDDGSILVVGQVVIGDTGASDDLAQGAVPCWIANPFGDVNCDGLLDAFDLAAFASQMDGPGNPISPLCPPGADLDSDLDGDLVDMAVFQEAYGGP